MNIKIFLITLCGLFLSFPTYAKDTFTSWEEDISRYEEIRSQLNDNEGCQTKFNILWHYSKEGNFEARFHLAFFLWGFLHLDHNFMPGHEDIISWKRDKLTVAVHVLGAWNPDIKKPTAIQDEDILMIFLDAGFRENYQLNNPEIKKNVVEFMECYDKKSNPSQCVALAVESRLVPPWDAYVAEIDGLIEAGYKPHCLYTERNRWKNEAIIEPKIEE